jgi:hypothetical protein
VTAAERSGLAVARVHHGVVRVDVEDAFGDVGEQLVEAGRVLLGVAHAAGEQGIAGEDVRRSLRFLVDQRHRTGSVAAQVDGRDVEPVKVPHIAMVQQHVHRHGQFRGVVRAGGGPGSGGFDEPRQGAHVVPVLVRGGDERQLRLPGRVRRGVRQQALDGRQVIRGVNQQLRSGLLCRQQIHVVVHLADRDPADGDVPK